MEKIRPMLYGVADYASLCIDTLRRTAVRRLTGTTDVSSVALHRLVLVFHGGDCVLSEEV